MREEKGLAVQAGKEDSKYLNSLFPARTILINLSQ